MVLPLLLLKNKSLYAGNFTIFQFLSNNNVDIWYKTSSNKLQQLYLCVVYHIWLRFYLLHLYRTLLFDRSSYIKNIVLNDLGIFYSFISTSFYILDIIHKNYVWITITYLFIKYYASHLHFYSFQQLCFQ